MAKRLTAARKRLKARIARARKARGYKGVRVYRRGSRAWRKRFPKQAKRLDARRRKHKGKR